MSNTERVQKKTVNNYLVIIIVHELELYINLISLQTHTKSVAFQLKT